MRYTSGLIAAAALAALGVTALRSAEPRFSLIIGAPSVSKAGSELRIKVALKNLSEEPLALTNHDPEGPDQAGPYVDVRDGQGHMAQMTERYRRAQQEGQDGSFFLYTIAPGETRESEILVNKLYDLLAPGKYTIQVQRTLGGVVVKSNAVTVTITK
jgi:hypothetical protein